MTDIAWYVALAWVLSTLGAGLACYWLGWRDRGEDDREQICLLYTSPSPRDA